MIVGPMAILLCSVGEDCLLDSSTLNSAIPGPIRAPGFPSISGSVDPIPVPPGPKTLPDWFLRTTIAVKREFVRVRLVEKRHVAADYLK